MASTIAPSLVHSGSGAAGGATPRLVVWAILGPPGSGKGTFASRLAPLFGLKHLSTGDLAREAAKEPGHSELRRLMNSGQLLPDATIITLLREWLAKGKAAGASGVLLDGFPRNLAQAQMLNELYPVQLALRIHLSDKHILAKLAGRLVCGTCGNGYNTTDIRDTEDGVCMPPLLPRSVPPGADIEQLRCDCGGRLSRRRDDAPEVAARRLVSHHAEEGPIMEFFRTRQVLVEHRVQRGVEDVGELCERVQGWLRSRPGSVTVSGKPQEIARL